MLCSPTHRPLTLCINKTIASWCFNPQTLLVCGLRNSRFPFPSLVDVAGQLKFPLVLVAGLIMSKEKNEQTNKKRRSTDRGTMMMAMANKKRRSTDRGRVA